MKQISLVILAVFIGLSAFAQTPTTLRADAVRLASRGYFNKTKQRLAGRYGAQEFS